MKFGITIRVLWSRKLYHAAAEFRYRRSSWVVSDMYRLRFLAKNEPLIVYYVPRRIIRVITRRATMLPGDQSRGAISPASILSESCMYPNCVHWHIFYFMWLRRIYKFLCVHSNPIWKGRNCREYRPSHLTFREYFRPFWFSRSCVVVAYCNGRMRSSNVQGFVSTVPTLYEE